MVKRKKKQQIDNTIKYTILVLNQNSYIPKNVFNIEAKGNGITCANTMLPGGHRLKINFFDEFNTLIPISKSIFYDRLILARSLEILEPSYFREDNLENKSIKTKLTDLSELYYEINGKKLYKKIEFVCNLVTISQETVIDTDRRIDTIVKKMGNRITNLEEEKIKTEFKMYEKFEDFIREYKSIIKMFSRKYKKLRIKIDNQNIREENPEVEELITMIDEIGAYTGDVDANDLSIY